MQCASAPRVPPRGGMRFPTMQSQHPTAQAPHLAELACVSPDRCLAMSTFGSVFRVTTFGESHCKGVGAIIDGVPPRMCVPRRAALLPPR